MAEVLADFRSDTVTRPDAAMYEAMMRAPLGDDVFGDDPTVIELEAEGARILGKEAGLFLPSGTMANQVAVRTHCRPGDEVILHEGCHLYRFEQGGLAALHGVQAVPLPGEGGQVSLDAVRAALRPDDPHFPRTRLLVVENTHNLAGGRVLPQEHLAALAELAMESGLKMHLDGARVMNAQVASGIPAAEIAAPADSATLCLSKGLGAPVGTLLAGSEDFIRGARRVRKLLGGGMRQAGVLAAAGLVALRDGAARLHEDHALARHLGEALGALPGVELAPVETNIVVAALPGCDLKELVGRLGAKGVLVVPFGAGRIRLVTHKDVGAKEVELAVSALAEEMSRLAG